MTDREMEIAGAKNCGFTCFVHPTELYCKILDRDDEEWVSQDFCAADEEDAWNMHAPAFLTDGNASDLLLAEADRRRWEWCEDSWIRIDIEGRGYVTTFFKDRTVIGTSKGTDRRRARLLAFNAACEALKASELARLLHEV